MVYFRRESWLGQWIFSIQSKSSSTSSAGLIIGHNLSGVFVMFGCYILRGTRKLEWWGEPDTVPEITKGNQDFQVWRKEAKPRDTADMSTCFMGYLVEEELDLLFVIWSSRSRITGWELHRSRLMLGIRRNLLTFRDVQKWNRLAHCHWEVFSLRLSDLKIIWLYGRRISALT